jgi:hypothetical protein
MDTESLSISIRANRASQKAFNLNLQRGTMFKIMHESIDYLKRARVSGDFGRCLISSDIFRGMSKNQKRKFRRYHKIPGEVSGNQRNSGIIRQTALHPKGRITEGQVTDSLWARSKLGDDTAQYLYKEIMKRKYPPRSRSFDTAQRIWERSENSKIKKGGRRSLK